MVQKLRKMVIAALLSIAVLGMSVSALPASAAQGSVTGCGHTSLLFLETKVGYGHVAQGSHEKIETTFYLCKLCDEKISIEKRTSEPHKQIPGTVFCECGYQLH